MPESIAVPPQSGRPRDFFQIISPFAHYGTYYVLPLVLLVIVTSDWKYQQLVSLGEPAELLLYATMFLKPVALLVRWSFLFKLLPFRRHLGVATFWFAFFHGVGLLVNMSSSVFPFVFDVEGNIFYGILALIGMTVMAVTSNDRSVRYLRKQWKRIHFLAYPTLFLVLVHIAIAKEEIEKLVLVSVVYIGVRLLAQWRVKCKQNSLRFPTQKTAS